VERILEAAGTGAAAAALGESEQAAAAAALDAALEHERVRGPTFGTTYNSPHAVY
jgi:hypothetical protein